MCDREEKAGGLVLLESGFSLVFLTALILKGAMTVNDYLKPDQSLFDSKHSCQTFSLEQNNLIIHDQHAEMEIIAKLFAITHQHC